jgi:hypothetical protein
MINDEAVRVVAATLRHTDWDDDNPGHREEMATEIVRALSRVEQSRVERALSTCERLLKAWHHNPHVTCCVEQVRDALLTEPTDSSADDAPAEQVCLIRAGYCACGPHQAPATTPGGVTYCSRCGCGIETDLPAEPSPRIELLDVPINDHKPTLNPPAEVKPSDCPIVLPEILARNIIRDAERMGDADRWRFLDEAAMRILPHVSDAPTAAANIAYNCAEALWAERQKRIDEQHERGRK